MNDDEVWTAVKNTFSDVQMDRPVEAIEQRGRRRRRNHGLVAGGALAAVAALAVAVPLMAQQSGAAPAGTDPAGPAAVAAGSTPALKPVAFTLAQQNNGSVKLTLDYKKVLDPAALEKALAGAGIPAVVRADVLCTPKGQELPESGKVFSTDRVEDADGSRYDLIIAPKAMPQGSIVYFSVFAVHKGEGYAKAAQYLVAKNAPMNCR